MVCENNLLAYPVNLFDTFISSFDIKIIFTVKITSNNLVAVYLVHNKFNSSAGKW